MHLSGTALGYYNVFHAKRLDFTPNLYMLSHYFCPFFIWRNNWTTGINKAISLIISVTLKDRRLFLMFEVTFFDIKLPLLPLTKVRDYVPCRNRTSNDSLGGSCYIHLTKETGYVYFTSDSWDMQVLIPCSRKNNFKCSLC